MDNTLSTLRPMATVAILIILVFFAKTMKNYDDLPQEVNNSELIFLKIGNNTFEAKVIEIKENRKIGFGVEMNRKELETGEMMGEERVGELVELIYSKENFKSLQNLKVRIKESPFALFDHSQTTLDVKSKTLSFEYFEIDSDVSLSSREVTQKSMNETMEPLIDSTIEVINQKVDYGYGAIADYDF